MSNLGTTVGENRAESISADPAASDTGEPTSPGKSLSGGAGGKYMPTYSLLFGGSAAMLSAALLGVGYFSQNGVVVLTGLAVFTLATVVLALICGAIIFWIVRNFLTFPRSLWQDTPQPSATGCDDRRQIPRRSRI